MTTSIPSLASLGLVLLVRCQLWGGSPGDVDLSFDAGAIDGGVVQEVVACPDGRLLVRGTFAAVQGTARAGMARIEANGTLDTSFDPGAGVKGTLTSWAVQADGRILLAGTFTQVNGVARTNYARLDADGTVDLSFETPPWVGFVAGRERRVLALVDGRSLDLGWHDTRGWSVFRHQPQGDYDSVFERTEVGTSMYPAFPASAVQPDGRLLLAPAAAQLNGVALNRNLIRLTADGGLDPAFENVGQPLPRVIALQAGGGIILGGAFTATPEFPRSRLARLTPGGALDPTYAAGDGPDGAVLGVVVLPDDRVLVWGPFANVNGVARRWVALLEPDGSVNADFDVGPTLDVNLTAAAALADGKLVVAGAFTQIGGVARAGLARVFTATDAAAQPPRLVRQPAGHTGELGQRTGFSVIATGALPMTYQWLRDGMPIAGATCAALALADLSLGDAGEYSVMVANAHGETRSEAARLEVVPARPRPGRMDLAYQPRPQLLDYSVTEGVLCAASQPDGKALVGGDFRKVGTTVRSGLVRLNADGTIDSGFGLGPGITNATGKSRAVRCVVLQTDARVLIGGEFNAYDRVARVNLARLMPDGTLDPTFDASTAASDRVQTIALQPDGKILVGGWFKGRLLRLLPRGVPDPGFTPDLGWPWVHGIAVQNDGKLVVCGDSAVARLNPDGSVDTLFGAGLTLNNLAWSVALAPDGGVFAGGWFTNASGQWRGRVARWDGQGQLDSGFDPREGASSDVTAVVPYPGNRLLATGAFATYRGVATRGLALIEPDGSWAADFRPGSGVSGGPSASPTVQGATLLPDGSILAVGNFALCGGLGATGAVRLVDAVQGATLPFLPAADAHRTVLEGSRLTLFADAKGSIPMTFQWFHDGTAIPGATSFTLLADRVGLDQGGDYAVAISNVAGSVTSLVAHVTVEPPAPTRWTVDPGFAPALSSQPIVTALVVQGDGKAVVGGQFTQVNGILRRRIVRLETDGAVDNTFDPGDGLDGWVSVLVLQPDGKILVGGDFERAGTRRRNSVARLHPDGSVDPTFEVTAPVRVEDLALLPNGQLLVAGRFVSAAGSGVVRVNSDGTLDPTFNAPASHGYESIALERSGTILGVEGSLRQVTRLGPDGGLDQTFALGRILEGIVLQPDDRILVGGFGVSRLNADGTLDPAWQLVPLNGITACLAVQTDGKILVGGDVHKPAGQPLTGLVRLHSDGTVDLDFDAHLGGPGIPLVRALEVLDRGGILVGGSFTQAGATTVSGLVRLLADGSIDTGFTVELECSGSVKALASLGPTNILVGGEFISVGNEERVRLASLGPDGALNPNFDLSDGPNSTVNAILPLGNDAASQVVLGGLFSSVNWVSSKGLVSLRDGVIAPVNILQSVSSDWSVAALVQQTDGRLLVGGGFGVRRTTIPPTLALDSQFTTDALDGSVAALASPDPATLLVGGWFNTVGAVAQPALAKLKLVSTGGSQKMTLDTSFRARLPTGAVVFVLQVDEDGGYLVGGDFTELSGQACAHFARVNPNGTLEATFDPNTGPNDSVRSLLSMPGGRALLAGDFTELGGLARRRLGSVRFDGGADPSFDPGLGANGRVNALLWLADGSLVVGGEFTTFDGVRRAGLVRLVPQPAAPVEPPRIESPTLDDRGFTVTVLTQPGIRYQLEFYETLGAAGWVSLSPVEGDGAAQSLHDPNPTGPQRFYRVSARR